MKYEISKELAIKLINYLATKPYAESFEMIAALQVLQPVETQTGPAIKEAIEGNNVMNNGNPSQDGTTKEGELHTETN